MVLPSSGWLLVTAMTRACPAPAVNTSEVRSDRNASPKSCGTVSDSSGTRLPRIAGTSPSRGRPSRFETSSGVLTVSSRYSIPNASPNATSMPAIIAVNHSRRVLGENGAPGSFGAIHHLHVVRAAVADDLQFLLLLQQRLPELSIAVGLTLKHEIAAALAFEIHRLVLLLIERRGEASFLRDRRLVIVLDALDDPGALRDRASRARS